MTKSKTRIGILGGGGILGAHLPAFRKAADCCEVVVVPEPDPNRHPVIRDLAVNLRTKVSHCFRPNVATSFRLNVATSFHPNMAT